MRAGAPVIEIEFVFVVVAAPQGAGVAPNHSSPPETTSVASPPAVIEAVTALVPGVVRAGLGERRLGEAERHQRGQHRPDEQ